MSKFDSLNTPVIYINLDEATARRKKLEDKLTSSFGNNVKRFPAVNAKQLASVDNPNYTRFMSTISMMTQARIQLKQRCSDPEIDSFGAIGCSLSHCFAWLFFANLANKDDFKYYVPVEDFNYVTDTFKTFPASDYLIVFEDDVKLPSNISSVIQKLVDDYNNEYGNDWDIFLLGYTGKEMDNPTDTKKGFSDIIFSLFKYNNNCTDDRFCEIKIFFGTHAYIIKKEAISKIMNQGFFPIEQHIDSYLGMLSQKGIIKIVGPKKEQFKQEYSKSFIDHGSPSINYITYYYKNTVITFLMLLFLGLIAVLIYIVYKQRVKNS